MNKYINVYQPLKYNQNTLMRRVKLSNSNRRYIPNNLRHTKIVAITLVQFTDALNEEY